MKKLIVVLIALLVLPSITLAAKGGNKPPGGGDLEQEIADREAADIVLQNQIDTIELTPGPIGLEGPPGAAGPGAVFVYDGNNVEIGTLLTYGPSDNIILSDLDYVFHLRGDDGYLRKTSIFFSTPDCSGDKAYVNSNYVVVFSIQGYVFARPGFHDEWYYIPKYSTVETLDILYELDPSSGCIEFNPTWDQVIAVYPNDPAVTGVLNSIFTTPITIGH